MFAGLAIIYLIMKGALFAALLKAHISSESLQEKPWLLAGIYTVGVGVMSYFYLNLEWASNPRFMQLWLGVSFVLSYLYYWLLAKFEDTWVVWWTVLILGLGLIVADGKAVIFAARLLGLS